jgi:hypothetical protein
LHGHGHDLRPIKRAQFLNLSLNRLTTITANSSPCAKAKTVFFRAKYRKAVMLGASSEAG